MIFPDFQDYKNCKLCPRHCGTDRESKPGRCGCKSELLVSRAALHYWEEPCISGTGPKAPGSGTVFFSGCSLGCCFCQNYQISRGANGKSITADRLGEIFLELQQQGAANINLVTPDHYLPHIERAIQQTGSLLHVPVAVNCSGYETLETVERMGKFAPIFMPDFKYFSSSLSNSLAQAPDYFSVASQAIRRMTELAGPPVWNEAGMLVRGVIVRHLVLPGHLQDSLSLLQWLARQLGTDGFILSLMSQYTPYRPLKQKELNRRLSSYEYRIVTQEADRLGFSLVYTQQRTAAKEEYTPPFDGEGV
ncbi:MAG: radical SAM protein [Pygmaiobacter massiliensis]|nr:radical SAM protein [Pygmaiobacter massiliensis]